jgi:hypothetical protein
VSARSTAEQSRGRREVLSMAKDKTDKQSKKKGKKKKGKKGKKK